MTQEVCVFEFLRKGRKENLNNNVKLFEFRAGYKTFIKKKVLYSSISDMLFINSTRLDFSNDIVLYLLCKFENKWKGFLPEDR